MTAPPRRSPDSTLMYREAQEASHIVAKQLAFNEAAMEELGAKLRTLKPRAVVTCARGSSDHATMFAKYVIETNLGLLVSSAAPSVSSVYAARQMLEGTVFIAISQSGKSPDLVRTAEAAKAGGAYVIALVNVTQSPLADLADTVIPLHAGPEKSVAATKSYIGSLSAVLQLVAYWAKDNALKAAVTSLPGKLREAWMQDWSAATHTLLDARNFFVVGRGAGFGVALEAALKFKETCGLHAEAYSAAEVKHGPMAIVGAGFPVLVFSQNDASREGVEDIVKDFAARGARVMTTGFETDGAIALPYVRDADAVIEPVLFIQSFYKMANALSLARGFNPDEPPHLNKVTETV
ncbi:SIS domain-containing protein [Kordiimonas aestuarii]|uniref:SIS domain-containing protein n=1 Tax=Kordiimonas aestuarii TaxID=1005925 RepID=UPI0021D3BE54|nr:SIS domain-containing protein [Kordiimonas aestuarii]